MPSRAGGRRLALGTRASYNGNYENPYAPLEASEITQAVYFLRKVLMTATMSPANGIGWKYDFGYQHGPAGNPPVLSGSWLDLGLFDYANPSISRDARSIPQVLFSPNHASGVKLAQDSNKIWAPLKTKIIEEVDSHAWCGWDNGNLWGAIWRYKEGNNYYEITTGANRYFEAPKNLSGRTATLYQFDFSQNPPPFQSVGTLYIDPDWYESSTGITTIEVPNVEENPIIIKF